MLFLPIWISWGLAVGLMFYWRTYWEGVAFLVLSDLLFGARGAEFFGVSYFSSLISIITLLGVEVLKKKLKLYDDYQNI